MNQETLEDVTEVARVTVTVDTCGVSQKVICKRVDSRKLPRAEYTGETDYAGKIAPASSGLFSADAALAIGRSETTTGKLMGTDS